jgi:predicted double-glycine peptidase
MRTAPVACASAIAFILAGCGGDPWWERNRQVYSLLEYRHKDTVVQQWDISCGAAATATILTYEFGDPVSEKEVAAGMLRQTSAELVRQRLGFSLLDMKRYVQTRGYDADGYTDMTVADLLQFGPTIVPIEVRGLNHFVVFRGMEGDRVLLSDPGWGNRTVTVAQFEKVWIDHIGFTITRAGDRNEDTKVAANELAPKPTDFWSSHAPHVERFARYAEVAAPVVQPDTMADAQLERTLAGAEKVKAAPATTPSIAESTRPATPPVPSPQPAIQRQTSNDPQRLADNAARHQSAAAAAVQAAGSEVTMLQRGKEALASGNVAAARLYFEKEAADGSGEAAALLADTYDDLFLRRHNVIGMRGDWDRMLSWLHIAADRGDPRAADRLGALDPRTTADAGSRPRS